LVVGFILTIISQVAAGFAMSSAASFQTEARAREEAIFSQMNAGQRIWVGQIEARQGC